MSPSAELLDRYTWWASLKHGGLLISPSHLTDNYPEDAEPLTPYLAERLRRDVTRVLDGDGAHLPTLLGTTLEGILGLNSGGWSKGPDVDPSWSRRAVTRETLKPNWLWQGPRGALLPVFVPDRSTRVSRIGIGRGRRPVSRVLEWLRKADQKLALLTNGREWRLLHAGAEYDAWCEWDVRLWFEEGAPSQQVTALRLLLGVDSLVPPEEDEPARLLRSILDSRKGQAELSSVLGERVRRAVEQLIRASSTVLAPLDEPGPQRVDRQALYIAATRMIMRCVVVLFAEARDLLPRDHPAYHASYGLQGLREQLDRRAGGRGDERLRHAYGAWPRLMALFQLVYQGSGHESLPVPRYGGGLFQPGDPGSPDPILRALAAFESRDNAPSDAAVHRILELLTRSRVKVRQGNRSTWVEAPVDFSDLSSEYIGILYEGLLDFELRRAEENEPMVFLNVGTQPAMPFSRLDAMSQADLKDVFEKLKKEKSGPTLQVEEESEEGDEEGAEDENEDEEAEDEGPETEDEPEDEDPDDEESADDSRRQVREMVDSWAVKAVRAAGLVTYPRDDTDPVVRERYHQEERKAADSLIRRLIFPGDWFLVRWGGTRKGSGTFYTRPQLAGPTTRRTLQPLAYEPTSEESEPEVGLATVDEWKPRTPEEILALKVCDPAMGSGSFLISALRFLADALVESLHFHERFESAPRGTVCKLADGLPLDHPSQETLPVERDHPEFEDRLRARLKRHLVERCLYGVDVDPLAVELGRMALWVETLDPTLPFGFLDHKLKCGNSLVGCWLDQLPDPPALAAERSGYDAGDKTHDGVHHKKDAWGKALKKFRNEVLKPGVREFITGHQQQSLQLDFDPQRLEQILANASEVFEALHGLPVHETRERRELYERQFANGPEILELRQAMNAWCALWFWPPDKLGDAPSPLSLTDLEDGTAAILDQVVAEHRFFHWELEFPDVFARELGGFDAMVGNPPWEIQKPNSKEFFSNIDPLYRTYGKQEALGKQKLLFEKNPEIEERWLAYRARFKSYSNWVRNAAYPFGDAKFTGKGEKLNLMQYGGQWRESDRLHRIWQELRADRLGYADPEHPFRHQGSADINTYKLFLEVAHALTGQGGQFGFLVPSGLYTDKGSTDLRELFLSQCSWKWLFGFENREKIFDIDSRFKFGPVIVEKGGETKALRAAFMHRNLDDWEEAECHVLAYPRDRVEKFSPKSKAILEIRSERDLEVLSKLYDNGVLLGDQGPDGWGIRYATEFHMTNDSHLFPPRPEWEARGYRSDEYGHWLKGGWEDYDGPKSILQRPRGLVLSVDGTQAIRVGDIEDVALPLYQG